MANLKRKNNKRKIDRQIKEIIKITECENCQKLNSKYNRILSHYSDIVHHVLGTYKEDDVLIGILDDIVSDFTKVRKNPNYKVDKK